MNSSIPIDEISLFEKDSLREIKNFSAFDAPNIKDNLCIHQWFENQAKEQPDAIAVKWQDNKVSYEQLDTRANQIKYELLNQNIGIGDENIITYPLACIAKL